MENNGQQEEITITPVEVDVVATLLQNMELVNPSKPECCIYTVPEYIKNGKEEFYRPFTTSIGPVFYEDPKLEAMQEHKRICLKKFRELHRYASQSYEPYVKFVRENEQKIRACYEQEIRLPRNEFIQMIVLDAAFIIYLFLFKSTKNDGPSRYATSLDVGNKLELLANCLGRDLFLEENQIPFFVLTGVYNIAFNVFYPCSSFTNLALVYIGNYAKIPSSEAIQSILNGNEKFAYPLSIQHLVDLQKTCCCLPINNQRKSKGKQIWLEAIKGIIDVIKCRVDLRRMCGGQKEPKEEKRFYKFDSAKHLSAAGVKFKLSESHNLMDITFDDRKGVLKIPKLTLDDDTEPSLRSILFFEQCHYVQEHRFVDYMVFLDTLIDTVEDVEVLRKKGILDHELGSDKDVVDLFNELTKNIAYNSYDFAFSDVSKRLRDYAISKRNKWKAILWSKYFNHPWAIISVFAAIILLILTVLQTITGFLQVTT